MPGLVYRFHDALTELVGSIKYQVAVGVGQAVKRVDVALNEILHDVFYFRFRGEEGSEIIIIFKEEGFQCTDTDIWFGHDRIAGYLYQLHGFLCCGDKPTSRHRYSSRLETLFHPGFSLDDINIPAAHPDNIKIVTECAPRWPASIR